jgi:DNA-binding CsgD family transcriptional regulator
MSRIEPQVGNEIVDALAGVQTRFSYLLSTAQLLSRLVPCEYVAWNSLDLASGSAEVVGYPEFDYDYVASLLVDVATEHPMVRSYLDDPPGQHEPRRLSDLISEREFRRTRTWSDLHRPTNVVSQASVLVARNNKDSGASWVLSRSSGDFSDEELDTLNLAQPLLATLNSRYVKECTFTAALESGPDTLTDRERDILRHLKTGRPPPAVAAMLGVSTRTVGKHLENAYRKLGVQNRLAAIARAEDSGQL